MKFCYLLLAAFFALGGCSYHHETKVEVPTRTYHAPDYRSSTSVGRLRRLAILPASYQTYLAEEDPSLDFEEKEAEFEQAVADYLREHKGYEIVMVRDSALDLEDSDLSTQTGSDDKRAIGIYTIELGKRLGVDGAVMLIGIDRKPWDTWDGIMNIVLMNGPLINRISSPNVKAWIFDAVHGDLIWSQEYSTFMDKEHAPVTSYDFESLFGNIDNAIPLHLID